MPGPRPTPVRLKLLRGNPGRRPIRSVFDPPRPSQPPDPPDFLTGDALEEWRRVAPGLHLFRLLLAADIMILAAYCTSYARWKTAMELLKDVADMDPKAHGLLVRGSTGQAKANPLIAIAREAAADMYRFACEFGFGPAARSRISAGVGPATPDKFRGLLAGGDDD